MNHLSDFDNEELLDMYELQVTENTTGIRTAQELLEDLKSIREEVLRRMTAAAESHCRMGVACPMHDGQVHGQEASELRTKLEALLEEVEGTKFTRSDPWEAEEVCYKIQIDVLDKVDCRDSLAFEEQAAVEFIVSSEHSDVPELTNMEKGTKTWPPVYRCPKCKEPLSTCELRRAGTLDILEKEPSTTPPWCESCVVYER